MDIGVDVLLCEAGIHILLINTDSLELVKDILKGG